MEKQLAVLDAAGLRRFEVLRRDAIEAVSARFYATHGADYEDSRGRDACREDLAFHLEFLRPVLEFGLLKPMVDYLRRLATVLASRDIPATHLTGVADLPAPRGARTRGCDRQRRGCEWWPSTTLANSSGLPTPRSS